MSFADRVAEHLRLVILRLLAETPVTEAWRRDTLVALTEAPGYAANLSLLHDALTGLGHDPTRDQLATVGDWLTEQGLTVAAGSATVRGLRLTQRGLDVAAGTVEAAGVAPPADQRWLTDRAHGLCLEVSLDEVEAALGWLEASGLVAWMGNACTVTAAGRDAASGRRRVEGVKVPSPDSIMAAAARGAADLLRQR